MKQETKRVLSIIFILVTLSGCSIGGGSNPRIIEPTLGQELIDLHQALETGVISLDEYDHLKEKLKRESH